MSNCSKDIHSRLSTSYPIDGLEPYISTKSLEIHYNRLYAGYVETSTSCFRASRAAGLTLEQLITSLPLPQSVAIPLSRYAGGVYNHILYFYGIMPQSQTKPLQGQSSDIDHFFGSFDHFRRNFSQAAQAVFGRAIHGLCTTKRAEIITWRTRKTRCLSAFSLSCARRLGACILSHNYNSAPNTSATGETL